MLTVQFQRQHQTRKQQIAGLSGGTSISVVQTISDCHIDRNYWLKWYQHMCHTSQSQHIHLQNDIIIVLKYLMICKNQSSKYPHFLGISHVKLESLMLIYCQNCWPPLPNKQLPLSIAAKHAGKEKQLIVFKFLTLTKIAGPLYPTTSMSQFQSLLLNVM